MLWLTAAIVRADDQLTPSGCPGRPHMSERPPADIAMDEALLRYADVRKRAQVIMHRSRELCSKSLRLRTRATELLTRVETLHPHSWRRSQ